MRVAVASWTVVLLLVVGCAPKPASEPAEGAAQESAAPAGAAETFPFVLAEEVEYYKTGPQQGQPPDGKFAAGKKVNVRRRTGSYSLVRTSEGVEGYVSSDAIAEPGAAPTP
jgi:uncharacterized protein YgiM (DUF1202 family)